MKKYWLKPISATASLALIILVSFVSSYTTFISPPAVASTKNDESIVSPQSVHYGMTTKELLDQLELVPARYKSQPRIGIYNPTFELPDKKQDYIQHSFVDWRDEHYLAYALSSTAQSGNIPLITIEPRGELDGSILLNDIVMGKYDERLNNIKTILSASKNPVYIRFAHEMELANLYAWGDQDSELFISAYKHVADILRTDSSNNTFLVWSPAGNIGAEKYYPGDQYVDVIGTTILYDEYFYGERVPSFEELAYGRKWLQVFNKPVWIVEFGAGNSNSTIQRLLIEEARAKYSDYGYSALIYLNLIDANIVGPDYRLRSYNDFYQLFDIGTRSEIDSLTCNLRQPYYSNHAERILGSPRPEAVCSDSQIQE